MENLKVGSMIKTLLTSNLLWNQLNIEHEQIRQRGMIYKKVELWAIKSAECNRKQFI